MKRLKHLETEHKCHSPYYSRAALPFPMSLSLPSPISDDLLCFGESVSILGNFREDKDSVFYSSVEFMHPSHILRWSFQEGLLRDKGGQCTKNCREKPR